MANTITKPTTFTPARLGHVNLFVEDLERSVAFYSDIAGIELVRREPGIRGAFHSNGNTHHDIGLIEVAAGARLGKGGFKQVSSYRGSAPGLNHFGWEMPSEAALIQALRRAEEAGLTIANSSDHVISHSVYIPDPDGNYYEFYADIVEKWREVFNLDHEDLVTQGWDWHDSEPGRGPVLSDPTDSRTVDHAIFHPTRITHATLAVQRFDDVVRFLTDVAGLMPIKSANGVAMFRGANSSCDLVLVSADQNITPGLRGISFEVPSREGLIRSAEVAAVKNIALEHIMDLSGKYSVLVRDPDGITIEFYSPCRGVEMGLPTPDRETHGNHWIFATSATNEEVLK
jgi:catechol 2,3-dioxygenase